MTEDYDYLRDVHYDSDRIYHKLMSAIENERTGNVLLVIASIAGEILSKPHNPEDAAEQFFEGVKMAMKICEEKPGTH